jgi:hypothetical protein
MVEISGQVGVVEELGPRMTRVAVSYHARRDSALRSTPRLPWRRRAGRGK